MPIDTLQEVPQLGTSALLWRRYTSRHVARRGARLSDLKLAAGVRLPSEPRGSVAQATHGAHPGTLSPIKLFVCADPICQTACCTTTLLKP